MTSFEKTFNESSAKIAKNLNMTKSQVKKMLLNLFFLDKKSQDQTLAILDSWVSNITKCPNCNALIMKGQSCPFETDKRNKEIICVVSSYEVLLHIEKGKFYNGLYFVLNSELNKKSPNKDIGQKKLRNFILLNNAKELIIVTSPTFAGEMTTIFLVNEFKNLLKVSRLGYGISFGVNLNYVKLDTLKYAFMNRKEKNAS